jgi:hypothetical protein
MPVQLTKRHHVVPAFYLRRFATADEKTTVANRQDPTSRFTTSVQNAGVEGYFYGIPTEEGWDSVVEDTLAKLEAIAANDLAKLISGRSSTLEAFRARLSFFMAVQFVRGRSPRRATVDFYKDLFMKTAQFATPEIIQAELKRQGQAVTLEEAIGIAAVGKDPTLTVEFQKIGPRQLPAESLVNAAEVFQQGEQLIPFFYERKWIISEFDAPLLLTSDEPVAIGVDTKDPHRPAGLANADSVVFPLDPRHALVMMRPDFDVPSDARCRGTPARARAINQLVVYRGNKQIFFHPETDPLVGLEIPSK